MKSLRVTWDVMSAPPQSKEEIALNSPFTDEPNGSSSKVTPDPTDIANVSDIVGDFGPWQRNIFAFFFVCGMFSAWHGLGLAFYAPDIDYWCRNGEWADVPLRAQLLEVKRGYHGNSTDGLQCTDLQGAKCSVWEFDDSQFTRTLTQEFGLVCDKAFLVSAAKSAYMLGVLVAVFLSQVADRVGRLPVVMGGIIVEVIAGILSSWAPTMPLYIASRFLLAMGNAARWGSGFVIVLEVIGPKYRTYLGIGIQLGWAAGYVLMPLVAYFVRDYRYLQLTCSIPQIAFVYLCWKFVPESPRWQLINGKFDDVEISLRHGATINQKASPLLGSDVEPKLKKLMNKFKLEIEESKNNITLIDLWKTPKLRHKTLILYFTWFVNGFVYYGLSFNTNSLAGNIYVNFFLSGFVEIPAYFLTIYVLHKYGRRLPLAGAMFGAGLVFVLTLPVASSPSLAWLTTALAMAGKFCITASFAIIYLYSAEIFPTVARTVGIGSSSVAARLGAVMAPFIKELGSSTHITVALAIFGLLSIANGLLVLQLPETKGKDIPDTLKEAEDRA